MSSLFMGVRPTASSKTFIHASVICLVGGFTVPAAAVVGQCCLPSGLCEDLEEQDCVAAGGVSTQGLVCAVGASGPLYMTGAESRHEAGSGLNHVIWIDVAQMQGSPPGTPVRLTGISWNLTIEAFPPSYLKEACLGFGDSEGEHTVVVCPGEGCEHSGTEAYSDSVAVDLLLSDGVLVVECFESDDDSVPDPDAVYQEGSWLELTYAMNCEPSPVRNVTKGTLHATIQDAIDAADPHDIIRVSPGTYHETIDFQRKALTVQGTGEPEDTVIDGGGVGSVVTMLDAPNGTSLSRFTLVGGVAPAGGGIVIDGAPGSVAIVDCVISDNLAANGGGIAVRNGAQPLVYDCLIEDNIASGSGGGIWVTDGSSLHLVDSTIELNEAGSGGGLLVAAGSTAMLDRLVVHMNSADVGAAAVDCRASWITLVNSLVSHNIAESINGAAMTSSLGGLLSIANSTIVRNTSELNGGLAGEDIIVSASILWFNAPIQIEPVASITVRYSNVQGGWTGLGSHNIDADPMFVDPESDFHLMNGSPCVNLGEMGQDHVCMPECSFATLPPGCLDLDWESRLQECRVDMGAYESPFFNDCNANGVSDACDVAPYYGFVCTAVPDLVPHLPGNSFLVDIGISIGISGNDDNSGEESIAWASLMLDIGYGTFAFDADYSSDDSGCADYPVFHLNGTFYGLDHDGTLGPPTDGSCSSLGTIVNGNPGGGHFVVDLESLAGPGPYTVGLGVNSVDSAGGPGVLTFSGFHVTVDADGDGLPDDCCLGDTDSNGVVDVDDLVIVILDWGTDGPHGGDVNGSDLVDVDDLILVVLGWGPCDGG